MPNYIQNKPQTEIETRSNLPQKLGVPQIGFVLDRSGSMSQLSANAIVGFNALIDEQKAIAPDSRFSLSLFSTEVNHVYDAVPVRDVPPMTGEVYQTDGGTALNDAIGQMIQQIGKQVDRGTRVLIAILTDGDENSSTQFATDDILQMVSYRRLNYDWQFIFIGPQHALSYGLKIGIPKSNIIGFDLDPAGIKKIMNRLSASVKAYQLGDRRYALRLKG